MLNLDDRNWKQFQIKDIITDNKRGRNYPKINQHIGKIPYISRTANNNGVTGFISIDNKTPKAVYINAISVNAGGSTGYAFYHPYTAYFGNTMNILFINNLTLAQALFVCTCIRQQRHQFDYGYELYNDRLMKLHINLPITKDGKPDWEFMNDYINQIFSSIPKSHIHNRINQPKESLNKAHWKQFQIKDIGSIVSSKDYPKKDRSKGTLPYAGRTRFNNGVTDYIQVKSNTPKTIYKNVIAVNRNGSTGYAFYHPYTTYCSGGVRVVKIKKLNLYVGLFLTTCIRQQRHQFSYGFELGRNRLKDLKINLPVTKDGQPDWQFMNDYIKSMMN